MKKLAVLYSGDSRGLNGAALYVDRFRKFKSAFKSAGIRTIICDSNKISADAKSDRDVIEIETAYANSRTHHMKNRIKRLLSNTYFGSKIFIYYAWEKPGEKSVKKNLSKIRDADVILANDLYCAYHALKQFPDKDLYFVMHNSGVLLKMLLDRLPAIKGRKKEKKLKRVEAWIFKRAKGILFVSRKARDTFIHDFPQHEPKAHYVPEGIEDIEHIPDLDFSKVNFICVGTVCDRKNQLELIKAFEQYKNSEISLTIVGGGSQLEECKSYVKAHHIKQIDFAGSVKNSDVPSYLAKSNVFVLASKDEGLPAVGIEALRSGLPILITDVGGCAELVQSNGVVLSGTNQKSIIQGMESIVSKQEQLPEMSRNSRLRYEREFSIEAMVQAYKKILVDEEYGA